MEINNTHQKTTNILFVAFISSILLFALSCDQLKGKGNFKDRVEECMVNHIMNEIREGSRLKHKAGSKEDFKEISNEKQMRMMIDAIYLIPELKMKRDLCLCNVVVDFPKELENDSIMKELNKTILPSVMNRVFKEHDPEKYGRTELSMKSLIKQKVSQDLEGLLITSQDEARENIEMADQVIHEMDSVKAEQLKFLIKESKK